IAVSIHVRGPPVNIRYRNMRTRMNTLCTRPPHLDPRRESAPIPAMPSAVIFQGDALRPHPKSPNSLTRDLFSNP
ncbi:hypothetical protein BJV77DRAFT_988436, partial [Russula vinacea]